MDKICIISGPSTVGKSKVIKKLCEHYNYHKIISTTTRKARKEERDGRDYWFVSDEIFNIMKEQDAFFHTVENSLGKYAYTKKEMKLGIYANKPAIMDLNAKSYVEIKEKNMLNMVGFFLLPPSFELIESRIRNRGKERGIFTENDIFLRINSAKREMEKAHYYDYIIINDNIEDTSKEINRIFHSI